MDKGFNKMVKMDRWEWKYVILDLGFVISKILTDF